MSWYESKGLFKVPEAAALLGIAPTNVYRLFSDGTLTPTPDPVVGAHKRVRHDELKELMVSEFPDPEHVPGDLPARAWFTVVDAANVLGVTKTVLWRRIHLGLVTRETDPLGRPKLHRNTVAGLMIKGVPGISNDLRSGWVKVKSYDENFERLRAAATTPAERREAGYAAGRSPCPSNSAWLRHKRIGDQCECPEECQDAHRTYAREWARNRRMHVS